MRPILSVPVVSLLAGCHAASPPSTARTPSGDPLTLLTAVANGSQTLASLTGDTGFAYALRREDPTGEDPQANADGVIVVTERVCGATHPTDGGIARSLAFHFEEGNEHGRLECSGLVCDARGLMEYGTSLRFVFEDVRGRFVLRTVFEIEDVAMIEAVAAERWREAEEAVRALPATCP
jgi:hypothetical protein